jgi:Raf kinase inhibitor-like YbhB/YbcL family protein
MKRALIACLLGAISLPALAQPGRVGERPVEPSGQPLPDHEAANIRFDAAVVEPLKLRPDLAALKVPEGYRIGMFAENLGNARMLAVAEDGTVYLTRRTEGDVQMLRDTNNDGRADQVRTVARRPGMHGIALDGRTVFLVTQRDVYTAPILADGSFGPLTRIIDDLPDTGQHPNRTIAIGPDGMLYISVGSTCNACTESSPESASIVRASKDGKSRTIYASGLRNTIGFDWHPGTEQLWGLDHGIDWLGDTQQIEELNRIDKGRQYGWPFIYGMGGHNPQDDPPGDLSMEDWDRMSERAVLGTDAHAAPMQMAFYRGAMFPAGEQGSAFAAFRGSWNRKEPSGYDVRRVRFDASGNPVAIEPFVTGFITRLQGGGWGHRGRLAGLAVARDGALLFSDDENGVIYRVSYAGPDSAGAGLPGSTRIAMPPMGGPIAFDREETQTTRTVSVSSPAFRTGAPLPQEHSAYYEDVSPPLSWGSLPAGTRSVALIMDDPDATSAKPFTHWVAWNIPPTMASLPEAVPTLPQLPALQNMRQGRNTRGSVGYFGPRPPIGDRPHRYHFQLFALDTMLDILPGSDRETLLRAMRGHVLAKGEVVGTYRQAAPPPK